MKYDVLASQAAGRLGVHRTTLVGAIRSGGCSGEDRDGRWYTSDEAAAAWYAAAYKHRGAIYSQTAGRTWSAAEIEQLRYMLAEGTPTDEIAATLKRAKQAIKTKASKLRAEGLAPSVAEVKAARKAPSSPQPVEPPPSPWTDERRLDAISLVRDNALPPRDAYQERRQMEREGRVRLHLHPEVKSRLGMAARQAGLTLAQFVTQAGLAAIKRPEILREGLRESEKIGIEKSSPQGVD